MLQNEFFEKFPMLQGPKLRLKSFLFKAPEVLYHIWLHVVVRNSITAPDPLIDWRCWATIRAKVRNNTRVIALNSRPSICQLHPSLTESFSEHTISSPVTIREIFKLKSMLVVMVHDSIHCRLRHDKARSTMCKANVVDENPDTGIIGHFRVKCSEIL
jgi:hypothetical protein